jgi:hypothetical protein
MADAGGVANRMRHVAGRGSVGTMLRTCDDAIGMMSGLRHAAGQRSTGMMLRCMQDAGGAMSGHRAGQRSVRDGRCNRMRDAMSTMSGKCRNDEQR